MKWETDDQIIDRIKEMKYLQTKSWNKLIVKWDVGTGILICIFMLAAQFSQLIPCLF